MFTHQPECVSHFMGDESFNEWFNKDMSVYHCEFYKELYDDKLFAVLGIKFPESLGKAVIKRRAEFLAGRYCAKKSLQKLGINNATVDVGTNRNPLWPQSIIGSISHCGSHAVAVTCFSASITGVGIDIEDEISDETLVKIQHQIIFGEEIPLVLDSMSEKLFLFTLLFSVKESFFKAAYPTVGKYFGFDAVSVVKIDRQMQTLSLRINETLHKAFTKDMLVNGAFHVLPGNKIVTLVTI